ncbi:MAG TPA: hypothetical protein VGV87_06425 [Blastocatellia bacterium]|jgi:hypothetical protein|nr:hypothetical protein [Blastocatellia bacterium]
MREAEGIARRTASIAVYYAREKPQVEKMHQQIVQYLTPMLGEATANNLLKHYCARMCMPIEEIGPGHLSDLANAMKPMLAVWLGSAGAARLAQELAELGQGANKK